jgi:uncharacterized iron-regulated membrane protein
VRPSLLNRRLHRWGAILIALPLLLVILSGVLLQLKKELPWVQPPTERGSATVPTLPFERILEVASSVPQSEIETWDDIERLDLRPDRGVVKVRARNRWEIQIDIARGDVLQVAYRRSDLIESLHDGSFFHDKAKTWIFLPAALILLMLWISGIYLWFLPHRSRRRRRRHQRAGRAEVAQRSVHDRPLEPQGKL